MKLLYIKSSPTGQKKLAYCVQRVDFFYENFFKWVSKFWNDSAKRKKINCYQKTSIFIVMRCEK